MGVVVVGEGLSNLRLELGEVDDHPLGVVPLDGHVDLVRVSVEAPALGVAGEEMRELAELATLSTMFTHVEKMRVVPFDWRSFGQLMASSFGSMATLLPILQAEGKVDNVFELLSKLFGVLAGNG